MRELVEELSESTAALALAGPRREKFQVVDGFTVQLMSYLSRRLA